MSPTASPLSSDASTNGAAAGSGRVGGATGTTAGATRAAGDALMTCLAAGGLACLACSGAGWLFSCGAVQRVRVLRGWQGAKEGGSSLPDLGSKLAFGRPSPIHKSNGCDAPAWRPGLWPWP